MTKEWLELWKQSGVQGLSVRMWAGEEMRFVFGAASALGGTCRGETSALGMEAGVKGKELIDPFGEVDAFRKEIGRESSCLKGPIDNIDV